VPSLVHGFRFSILLVGEETLDLTIISISKEVELLMYIRRNAESSTTTTH